MVVVLVAAILIIVDDAAAMNISNCQQLPLPTIFNPSVIPFVLRTSSAEEMYQPIIVR